VNLQGGNILEKYKVIDKVKDIKSIIDDLSIKIWENPEIAGEEKYASALFKDILKNNGFAIKEINNMEYAFIAEYGSGHPVIAVLGEYDALAGMSQKIEAVIPVIMGRILDINKNMPDAGYNKAFLVLIVLVAASFIATFFYN
jgi:metal-dependent amidase/aminoacylase/carboxypeptidase family protein